MVLLVVPKSSLWSLVVPPSFSWSPCPSGSLTVPPTQAMPSQNPVLKHITDYLIEEVSAEEEELLGRGGGDTEEGPREANPTEVTVERDEKLLKVGRGGGESMAGTPWLSPVVPLCACVPPILHPCAVSP